MKKLHSAPRVLVVLLAFTLVVSIALPITVVSGRQNTSEPAPLATYDFEGADIGFSEWEKLMPPIKIVRMEPGEEPPEAADIPAVPGLRAAAASDPLPTVGSSSYGRDWLANQKDSQMLLDVYDKLYLMAFSNYVSGFQADTGHATINIPDTPENFNLCSLAMSVFFHDNPQFFFFKEAWFQPVVITHPEDEEGNPPWTEFWLRDIYVEYSYNASERQRLQQVVQDKFAEYEALAGTVASAYDKARLVHDKMLAERDYSVEDKGEYFGYSPATTIIGVMDTTTRGPICTSYALSYAYILNRLGIETIPALGMGYSGDAWAAHSWDLVKLNGSWYYVDPGFDDLDSTENDPGNKKNNLTHQCFMVGSGNIGFYATHQVLDENTKVIYGLPYAGISPTDYDPNNSQYSYITDNAWYGDLLGYRVKGNAVIDYSIVGTIDRNLNNRDFGMYKMPAGGADLDVAELEMFHFEYEKLPSGNSYLFPQKQLTRGGDYEVVIKKPYHVGENQVWIYGTGNSYRGIDFGWVTITDCPILSHGTAERPDDQTAIIGFRTDEDGTAYYCVVEKDAPPGNQWASWGQVNKGAVTGKSVELTDGEWDVYVKLENAAGKESNLLAISVPLPDFAVSVDVQPAGYTIIAEGDSMVLSLTASANRPDAKLTYQWYQYDQSDQANPITSEGTSPDFTTPAELAAANSPYFYSCLVRATTDNPGEAAYVWSEISIVEVAHRSESLITILIQPEPVTTVTQGAVSGSLYLSAEMKQRASIGYQWYANTKNSNTGGTLIAGANTAALEIPKTLTSAGSPYYYYCLASSPDTAAVRSDVARVNVLPAGGEAKEIKTAQIAFSAPEIGGLPDQNASVEGSFTVASMSWSPDDASFENGKAYTATATLTADSQHTFTGIKAANTSINGNKAVILANDGQTLTLSYTFPALRAAPTVKEIKTAVITVATPGQGIPQDTAAAFEGDSFAAGPVSWTPAEPAGLFIANTPYTAALTLTAQPGYTFAGIKAANIAINGKKATILGNDGATLRISYTFPGTKYVELIDHVEIRFSGSYDIPPIPVDIPHVDISLSFSPEINFYDAYYLGVVYTITATLTAHDGYSFAGINEENIGYFGGSSDSMKIVSNSGSILTVTGLEFQLLWA